MGECLDAIGLSGLGAQERKRLPCGLQRRKFKEDQLLHTLQSGAISRKCGGTKSSCSRQLRMFQMTFIDRELLRNAVRFLKPCASDADALESVMMHALFCCDSGALYPDSRLQSQVSSRHHSTSLYPRKSSRRWHTTIQRSVRRRQAQTVVAKTSFLFLNHREVLTGGPLRTVVTRATISIVKCPVFHDHGTQGANPPLCAIRATPRQQHGTCLFSVLL